MERPPGPGPDRFARALLALALAAGLLRFVRLERWSLWIDEALTWADAHHGIGSGQISNPVGYVLIRWTVELLGGRPDEFALRLLPAVCGWLAIPAAWAAFRAPFGERRAGLVALLLALSSWHVYWSQNARFYTLAQLAALCGAGLVLSALARGSIVRGLGGLALAAAAALLHPTAALLLPVLAFAPAAFARLGRPFGPRARRPALALALSAALALLLALPWGLETWRTYALAKGQEPSLAAALSSAGHFVKTTGFFVTPLLGAAALVGAWHAWRARRGEELLAVAMVATPLAIAFAASFLVRVSAQYVFVAFPWIALLASLPLARQGEPRATAVRGALGWILLLALPALATTGLYLTVRQGERPPWREAFQFIAARRAPGEMVFGMEACVGEYYLAPWNTDLRRPTALTWLDTYRAREPLRWVREGRPGWYVVNPEQYLGWRPEDAAEFQRFLRERCRLERVWPLYVESRDLSVWVWRSD